MNSRSLLTAAMLAGLALPAISAFALECVDASGEAFGSFKSISIDPEAATVVVTGHTAEPLSPAPVLVKVSADLHTYHFNQDIDSDRQGTRLFKLFYIEMSDAWRMIDSVVFEESGVDLLIGVSNSVSYDCTV